MPKVPSVSDGGGKRSSEKAFYRLVLFWMGIIRPVFQKGGGAMGPGFGIGADQEGSPVQGVCNACYRDEG